MPRFSINVSMMLQEYSFLERFQVAADVGFSGVDIQFPYDTSPQKIAGAVKLAGVEVVLFNLPAGDLIHGGSGLAAEPGQKSAFQEGVRQALPYVEALGNKRVNVLTGKIDSSRDRQEHIDTLIENLEYSANVFTPLDVTVMVEPVNGYDVPNYLLQTLDETIKVINKVGDEKIKIQFDVYHRYRMEEDVIVNMEKHLSSISHIQFADSPGRHEPGTGKIDFADIFGRIDTLGYAGWVGAEYIPSKPTLETLDWFQQT